MKVGTRRVTQYIVEEAYKWLYERIKANEYQAPSGCREGRILLLQISTAKAVTEKTYKDFLKLFDNSPFSYMMNHSKRNNGRKLTTNILQNYFVSYNGSILPLGFIKDFFEDDYETQQEVKALLADFAKSGNDEVAISWRHMLINKENAIEHLYDSYPSLLKVHPTLLITQIVRLIITGLLTAWVFIGMNAIEFWGVMQKWMKEMKFSFVDDMILDKEIAAFGNTIEKGAEFTISDYIGTFGLHLLVAVIILLILIGLYEKLIKFVVFVIRMAINNFRLNQMKGSINRFEHNGIDALKEYFDQIIPSVAQVTRIQESDCEGVPSEKNLYVKISTFDHQKLDTKFSKLVAKYYDLKFTYDPKSLAIAKKTWTKGIVFNAILTIVFAFLMVPQLFELMMKVLG